MAGYSEHASDLLRRHSCRLMVFGVTGPRFTYAGTPCSSRPMRSSTACVSTLVRIICRGAFLARLRAGEVIQVRNANASPSSSSKAAFKTIVSEYKRSLSAHVKRSAFALRASVERDMPTASLSTLISIPIFLDSCSRKENGRPLRMHSCSLVPRLGSPRLSLKPAVGGAPGRYSSTKGWINSP